MPDQLFDQFHLDITPVPVEEVRRRGDRRRRRTAAAVSILGAAAVVAVVAPIALLGHGADRGQPQPSHTGSVSPTRDAEGWVTAIPQSFDLTSAMATTPRPTQQLVDAVKGTGNTVLPLDVGGCDAPMWQASDAKQTLVADWTDGTEAMQTRSLSTYADGKAAAAAFDRITQGVTGCPGGPLSPIAVALGTTRLPQPAVAWVQPNGSGGTLDGTGTAYVVVQVDNVLIIDRANLGGAGDAAARSQTIKNLADRLRGVTQSAATAFPAPANDATGPFGPAGFGKLQLGMTPEAAVATGEVVVDGAGGYRLSDGSPLCFQPGDVLTAITAPADARTPQGIGAGATTAQVRAAFHLGPHARDAGWSVPAGPGASYHFFIVPGKGLTELTLEASRQDCWG